MKYFEYKTRNRISDKIFRGIMTADDIESAAETLKRQGEEIVEIDEMRDFFNIRKSIYNLSSKTSKKVLVDFFAMLALLLSSGKSLHETLVDIRDSSENNALKNFSKVIAEEVRKGASLSTALKKSGQVEEALCEQITAGEESGDIIESLKRINAQLVREMEFKSKIKSAMMYPAIISVVMVAVLWVMMTMVVPALAQTLISMGGELPLITKIVIGVSNFLSVATPYMVIGAVLLVIGYKIAVKDMGIRYRVDTFKLKIPMVGMMLEKIELSRFARNLSAMQKSGISLVRSLAIVEASIKNQAIAEMVKKAHRLVELSGMSLYAALSKSGKFPPMMLQLINSGISSGRICEMLERISEQYEKDTDTQLKRITSIIEPAMIVVVGLLAGTVVISIFLPMFSMVDAINV